MSQTEPTVEPAEDEQDQWVIDGQVWTPGDFLRALEARDQRISTLQETIDEQAARIDALEGTIADVAADTEAQKAKLQELDDRTDMLSFVERASETTAEEARVAILQHMWRMVKDEDQDDRKYAMDWQKTKEILHNPDVDRTTVLRWMRTAPQLVGNETLCWYSGGEPGPTGAPARVYLDLTSTDSDVLPSRITTPRSRSSNNSR